MADTPKTIDQLDPAGTITGVENLHGRQNGKDVKIAISNLITAVLASADPLGTATAAITDHLNAFSHANINHLNRVALDLVTGTNSGDQDLSGLAVKAGTVLNTGVNLGNTSQAAGNVLDWYEEGTWTPMDGSVAGTPLVFTVSNCKFTRIGNMVFLTGDITYPTSADTNAAYVAGLPFDPAFAQNTVGFIFDGSSTVAAINVLPGQKMAFYNFPGAGGGRTNTTMSAKRFIINIAYRVA
jgi:hypothetical protein